MADAQRHPRGDGSAAHCARCSLVSRSFLARSALARALPPAIAGGHRLKSASHGRRNACGDGQNHRKSRNDTEKVATHTENDTEKVATDTDKVATHCYKMLIIMFNITTDRHIIVHA